MRPILLGIFSLLIFQGTVHAEDYDPPCKKEFNSLLSKWDNGSLERPQGGLTKKSDQLTLGFLGLDRRDFAEKYQSIKSQDAWDTFIAKHRLKYFNGDVYAHKTIFKPETGGETSMTREGLIAETAVKGKFSVKRITAFELRLDKQCNLKSFKIPGWAEVSGEDCRVFNQFKARQNAVEEIAALKFGKSAKAQEAIASAAFKRVIDNCRSNGPLAAMLPDAPKGTPKAKEQPKTASGK